MQDRYRIFKMPNVLCTADKFVASQDPDTNMLRKTVLIYLWNSVYALPKGEWSYTYTDTLTYSRPFIGSVSKNMCKYNKKETTTIPNKLQFYKTRHISQYILNIISSSHICCQHHYIQFVPLMWWSLDSKVLWLRDQDLINTG